MMKRQLDCLCFFKRKDLLRDSDFRAIDPPFSYVDLVGLPIDSTNALIMPKNLELPEVDCFMTSPLCGINSIGPACAISCESGKNHPVYGFSQSVGRSISSVTVASIWLAYASAILVAKIKLKSENEFLHHRCFENKIFIDVKKYIESIDMEKSIKDKAMHEFSLGNIAPISALADMDKNTSYSPHVWLASWRDISNYIWSFPNLSLSIAAALDARYLSGSKPLSGYESVSGVKIPLSINRSNWSSKSFDINTSFIDAACLRRCMASNVIFAHKVGIFAEDKSSNKNERVEELWFDTLEFCHALFSDRIKWDYTKQAVKNWYISMLRKYGNDK